MVLEIGTQVSVLQGLWLAVVALLWVGFFFLEGFDFGVGMLIPFLGRGDKERRVVVNTIGPLWDGNEVWLVTAAGGMLAAFPGWYATLFSALYLPLLLVLVGLILRGVAFEYRGKSPSLTWRNRWDWCAATGSFLVPLVFGIGFANLLIGLPVTTTTTAIGSAPLYGGSLLGLFSPLALVGGLLFVTLFLTHGAVFIAFKTKGEIHTRAEALATRSGLVTLVLLVVFVVWGNLLKVLPGQLPGMRTGAWAAGAVSVLCVAAAVWFARRGREGLAFLGTGIGVIAVVVMIFLHLFPGLGFDSTAVVAAGGQPLDVTTAASSPRTLTILTVAAGVTVPVVVGYQIWSYRVFRRRLSVDTIPDDGLVSAT
ncbi:MAG: cytochrome d ubiquinol oxidase subunit II [Actinomycetia bacterium]|nr:cytochrome d ubiquinol oxidase subunit II [Actinomycetes bacterium]